MLNFETKARDWETTFQGWSQPPSQTEIEKCERAVNAIKKAVANSVPLGRHSVTTFAQGSYRNRTNVRQESDVDVCVLCSDTIIVDYPAGVSDADTALSPASYLFSQYKDDVGTALGDHFGYYNVQRGNKAFDIHENTYRVDADAAPCFEFRQYYHDSFGTIRCHKGTALYTDRERKLVTNFPEQQYGNGVAKNDATGRRFKKIVRILKRLKSEMAEADIPAAKPIPSFLIECLVWNAPYVLFAGDTFEKIVRDVVLCIWSATRTDEECARWMEENGIKHLFGLHQEWSRSQVNNFAAAAWSYIEPR